MTADRARETGIREDVRQVIEKAFPEGIIDMSAVENGGHLREIYPQLHAELSKIADTALLRERSPEKELHWEEGSDPDKDPPDWTEPASSYHLFFIGLTGEEFRYQCDSEEPDENDVFHPVEGTGIVGCAVGVSLLAPFAVVKLGALEEFESGSESCPDVEPSIFNLDGTPADLDEVYREMFLDEGVQALHRLRGKIESILESLGIAPLPDDELSKPVPWLRGGDDLVRGTLLADEPITVRDALFFRCR